MGKKKFIKKGEGQTFHLLHRSQRDSAYANEERPSDFVLVPANESREPQRNATHTDLCEFSSKKDHIDAFGFRNDGYDYSQHLKTMGQGKFIGKDGKLQERPAYVDLPAEVLPSNEELDRNFQAITISSEFMDEDIRAGLFDEEGEFEELDDDFVAQVMVEPEVPDFDFDAHIAKLIAQSENHLLKSGSSTAARGWSKTDQPLEGKFLRIKNKRGAVEFGSEDEESMGDVEEDASADLEDEDEEEFSDYHFSDEEDQQQQQQHPQRGKSRRQKSGSGKATATEGALALDEEGFDQLLAEYEDDQLGYMEEIAEADIQGEVDVEGDDELFQKAITEYLQEESDRKLCDGVSSTKNKNGGISSFAHLDDKTIRDVDVEAEYREQLISQAMNELPVTKTFGTTDKYGKKKSLLELVDEGDDKTSEAAIAEVLECQEYLRQVTVREEWDCETILSTYSTLDNHPSLIRDPKSKFRPHKSRHARHMEAEQEKEDSVAPSHASTTSVSGKELGKKIVLTGKLMLPQGYASSGHTRNQSDHNQPGLSEKPVKGSSGKLLDRIPETAEVVGCGEEEEESGDDSHQSESGNHRRGETAEEKKLRKAAVKEERRQKRSMKKQLKSAFNDESRKVVKKSEKQLSQRLDNISVFRY